MPARSCSPTASCIWIWAATRSAPTIYRPTRSSPPCPTASPACPANRPNLRIVPTDMRMDMHMIGAMYAPVDWVTLIARGSYVTKEMDHVTYRGGMGTSRLGGFTTSPEGIGDITVGGLFPIHPGIAQSRACRPRRGQHPDRFDDADRRYPDADRSESDDPRALCDADRIGDVGPEARDHIPRLFGQASAGACNITAPSASAGTIRVTAKAISTRSQAG